MENLVIAGSEVTLMGWGYTSTKGPASTIVLQTVQEVLSSSVCAFVWQSDKTVLEEAILCTSTEAKRGACRVRLEDEV